MRSRIDPVGPAQDFADALLSKALARFAKANPNVRVEVRVERTGVLVDAVGRDHLDLALAWADPAKDAGERVAELDVAWIGPTGSMQIPSAPLSVVAFEQPCVQIGRPCGAGPRRYRLADCLH